VGPGGAGKTSLAIEVARSSTERFPDGTWLVRLAPLTQGDAVPHAIADALALGLEGGTAARRPLDVLVAHLSDRELLLVLDNCEHVVEDAASVVDVILERCPTVAVLATSREALATPDEVQVVVAPLPVPTEGTPAAEVASYPAARLFLDRARATDLDRTFDDVQLEHVATICRRLDGIPLALELAAARLSTLSTAELADRVRDRFALLT
jgi:predicted ATPase